MGFGIPEWAMGAAIILIAIQVGRAISGRAGMRRFGRHDSDADVAELQQSLAAMQRRVAELEERVDFTERLLAKQRESDRLNP